MLAIHERIFRRHPELAEEDVRYAWENAIRSVPRIDKDTSEFISVGFDRKGRSLEMVAKRSDSGNWLVYHAMTPPSIKTLDELNLGGERHEKR